MKISNKENLRIIKSILTYNRRYLNTSLKTIASKNLRITKDMTVEVLVVQ
jgi:hypothetical protein